jgi:hypothetical protein
MPKKEKSTLSSYHNCDMDKDPWTIGELVEILSDFDQKDELRFVGWSGELFFHRFKRRGEKLMTIEFDDPGSMEDNEAWNTQVRNLKRQVAEARKK